MFGLIEKLRARYRWTYVATAEAETRWTDKHGNYTGDESHSFFVLSQRGDGKRRYVVIGEGGSSKYANQVRAAVEVWRLGGPSVPAHMLADQPCPTPKPKAELLVFPGGKGAK